jgi:hypothetical protein
MKGDNQTLSIEQRIAGLEQEIQTPRASTPLADKAKAALVISTAAASLDMDTLPYSSPF